MVERDGASVVTPSPRNVQAILVGLRSLAGRMRSLTHGHVGRPPGSLLL